MLNIFPRISIVTPNYNQAAYIEETILSVLNQGYPNLEYIIIDGGSTDGSVDIIKKYENRLAYWVSEPDNGMYEAIQKGFDKSTGEIMAWINSDDMYHRNSLFTVGQAFNSLQEINWLTGLNTFFDENSLCVHSSSPNRISKYDYYQNKIEWIQQESTFWRRSLWNKAGGYINKELKYAGDMELWLRFFRHSELVFSNILIGGFRMRSKNQLSLDHLDLYYKEAYACIKREEISEKDINYIAQLNQQKRWERRIKKIKLINPRILNRVFNIEKMKFYEVIYDRQNMKFNLKYA